MKETHSTDFKFQQLTLRSWEKRLQQIRKRSSARIAKLRAQGDTFIAKIIGPRYVRGGTKVPFAAATVELDWKTDTKLKMVKSARDFATAANMLDQLDGALPTILASVIEGKGLYEHGIGEFFLLYGKFEQKHGTQGLNTKALMEKLIGGDGRYMRDYIDRSKSKTSPHPLPYTVRNILSHSGRNPNTLDQDGNDLKASIELLKLWTADNGEAA